MGSITRKLICLFLVLMLGFGMYFVPAKAVAGAALITELQTESATDANQEYIEITNTSLDSIDISGWRLQYRAATGTAWLDKAELSGTLYPGGSIVVATQGYLVGMANFFWTMTGGVLAASGGNIRLIDTATSEVHDTVAWGTGIYGEGAAATKASKGFSLQRKIASLMWQDTNSNIDDFQSGQPDPITKNDEPPTSETSSDAVITSTGDNTQAPVGQEQNPDAADDSTPTGNVDVPQPDPDVPLSDSEDQTTDLQPIDNFAPPDSSDPTPTISGQENSNSSGTDQQTSSESAVPLLPILINELMIDPVAPLTDANDEWVELYNPNEQATNLAGYVVQTGSTFSHSYTVGDIDIGPHEYIVFYSGDTSLALSNTSGAARLLNPIGGVSSLVSYDDVEQGHAYALDKDAVWQWTTTPTAGQENIITAPSDLLPALISASVPKPKSTSAKTSTSTTKTKAPTSAAIPKTTTKTKASNKTASSTSSFNEATPKTPSHSFALAVFGIIAVGYACYEYREDAINKMRIARRYIQARRAARSSL